MPWHGVQPALTVYPARAAENPALLARWPACVARSPALATAMMCPLQFRLVLRLLETQLGTTKQDYAHSSGKQWELQHTFQTFYFRIGKTREVFGKLPIFILAYNVTRLIYNHVTAQ